MAAENTVRGIIESVDTSREDFLETLKEYIRFKTINKEQLLADEVSEIKQCQEWIYQQLKALNYFDLIDIYEIEKDRPNVVAVKRGKSTDAKSLMLNAHSDVVRVSKEQAKDWEKFSPFEPGIDNNTIWGRGAADMKGGGTAMLYAVKALQDLGIEPEGDLYLSYVIGEESGRAEEGIWSIAERGYKPQCAIMCEPTGLRIYNKTRGEIYYDIELSGKSTHICNRYKTIWPQKEEEEQLGVNAIDKAVKMIEVFRELERSWGLQYHDDDFGPGSTTLAVSMIKGGESFSAQAGDCSFTIASMFDPKATVEEIKGQIEQAIEFVADQDHWMRDNRPVFSTPFPPKVPINIDGDDEFVRTVQQSYTDVLDKTPFVGPAPFVGDANYLYEKGVKSIYFGPGDIGRCHGTNEYIDIDELLWAAKIYAQIIINWCK